MLNNALVDVQCRRKDGHRLSRGWYRRPQSPRLFFPSLQDLESEHPSLQLDDGTLLCGKFEEPLGRYVPYVLGGREG